MAQGTGSGRVLLVDDDAAIRDSLSAALDDDRWELATAADGGEAVAAARQFAPEVVLLDLGLPDVEGLELIPRLRELDELTRIVVLTASSEIATVVRAMQRGADNFLVKPVSIGTLDDVLVRCLEQYRTGQHHRALRVRSERGRSFVGSSSAMRRVGTMIAQVADTDATVLLEGESGTGKGLAAEEIHRLSGRANGPFVDMNCAALSPGLVESELFGHERGAFTDASRTKPGLLEIASGGTVFLDEIGELAPEIQSKLLKVLEDRRFRRVGGVRDVTSNVRVIAATNRNLKDLVAARRFRQDLYYRLNVFAISIPPLRERPGDILELAHHFLGRLNETLGTAVDGLDPQVEHILTTYRWPGNVREVRNVLERAVILARSGIIEPHHLPSDVRATARARAGSETDLCSLTELEAEHIQRVLTATNGNVKRSAEVLGISRTTLYAKIQGYGLEVGGPRGAD